MVQLAGQMKNALTLLCSLGSSIAFGFASRRFDQSGGLWHLPAAIGTGCFLIQLCLVFLKSKEEVELAEFKRIQTAQNEQNAIAIENLNRTNNALTTRIVLEIESGNLEQAEKWTDFQRRKTDGK